MTTSDKDQDFEYGDIMACTYCRHFEEFGAHASNICKNPANPYRTAGAPQGDMKLTIEQSTRGCRSLAFIGEKLPASLYKQLPSDSYLRTLPPEQVVIDFSPAADLSSKLTAAQISQDAECMFEAFLDLVTDVVQG